MKALWFALFFVLLSSACFGLSAEKIVSSKTIDVNNELEVFLEIVNDLNQDVNVRITDENILGNSGLKVKCFDAVIPTGKTRISYGYSIKAYSPGDYILASAKVTDIGSGAVVETNTVDVTVKGSQGNSVAGVTEIYRCNGISSTSSSFSSGGNIQVPVQEEVTEEDKAAMHSLEAFLYESEEFTSELNSLLDLGFIPQKKEFVADDDRTGTFLYEFVDGDKKVVLSGNIEDGIVIGIKKSGNTNWLFYFVLFAVIVLFALFFRKKKPQPEVRVDRIVIKDPFDAKECLKGAVKLFDDGKVEDAFSKLAFCTREVIKRKIDCKEELTNDELIAKLSGRKYAKQVENLLNICNKAVFAKQHSKEKFSEARKIVEKLV